MPGSEEKRRSTVRPWVMTWMRPSCGRRRSAMSRCAITFRRETIAGCSSTRGDMTSYRIPSILKRMRDLLREISMWMSLALSWMARWITALTMLMTGLAPAIWSICV